MFIASVCPSVRPSVRLSVWNQNLVVRKQNLTMMQGPRSGREGGPRSGPEKLSSAPRSTSSIMWVWSWLRIGQLCDLISKRMLALKPKKAQIMPPSHQMNWKSAHACASFLSYLSQSQALFFRQESMMMMMMMMMMKWDSGWNLVVLVRTVRKLSWWITLISYSV